MANNIELITKFSPKAWDTVYKQEAVSSKLDTDSRLIQFTGAKTVKIGKWQNGGLHNYYRNNTGDPRVDSIPGSGTDFVGYPGFGYQKSAARLVWEEFTLKCDRAAAFQIEKFDNEESGEELVGLGVTEISRTTIVPEVDAYCFSTIAGYTNATIGNRVSEDISSTPLAKLNAGFKYMADHEVPVQDQLVLATPAFMKQLRETSEVTKFLGQTDYDNKDVKFLITKYEGREIIEVSPDRLRTDIRLDAEGYSWKSTSRPINFMIVSKSAVTHVVKYEKVKVIGDDLNLAGNGFDGYTIYARIYHDVFVPDNKVYGIYASVASTDAASRKLFVTLDANDVVDTLGFYPNDLLVSYGYVDAASAPTTIPGTINTIKKGDDMTTVLTGKTNNIYVYAYMGGVVLDAVKISA